MERDVMKNPYLNAVSFHYVLLDCYKRLGLTEEELSAKLMERVYLYEKNFLSDDTDILDRSITTEKNPETLTLCVKYKLEGNIAEQRELMIK